jgi:starch phosphorylase
MFTVREYTVLPTLPESLNPLRTLAMNLWWAWNTEAQELFRRLDPALWRRLEQNPIKLLNTINQNRLREAAADDAFLAHLERVQDMLEYDMTSKTWFEDRYPELKDKRIAYISAEFGVHECLPQYSGGLGILAGDLLKSASDLGVPVVGVSLLYRYGYFHQHLSNDGWQFEEYPPLDLPNMPISLLYEEDGQPRKVTIDVEERQVKAQIWQLQVGRVPLYLLDTYLPENKPEDREITGKLYGGDQEMRIRQEIVLGIGGLRALEAVGCRPDILHMNEGHCAFAAIERLRRLVEEGGLSLAEAKEAVTAGTLFTTHTPVPAGIDVFPPDLVAKCLRGMAKRIGISREGLLALGQYDPSRESEPFSMAIVALRLSSGCNGVSKLHGSVARRMWHPLWKNLPREEVPITSITNGVHIRTWQSREMARLFERYLGPDWSRNPYDEQVWSRVDEIPDAELWQAHERLRERLVVRLRERLKKQLERRGAPPSEIAAADGVLNPEALTIGFARRFATYKRATLFLEDPQRMSVLLSNNSRPVQMVFAGKAHPRDEVGKEFIKNIVQFARKLNVRNRLVFLEDYSMGVARELIQGVDVWLNNPIKLLEASGTSGMKTAPNGGINLSILDGWWPEAYDGTNGWAIGGTRVYENNEYQDRVDSESIYELLEREIIPLFYERGADGLPSGWVKRMKASMRTCSSMFSANRMVREYTDRLYVPTIRRAGRLAEHDFSVGRSLAAWKAALKDRWPQIRIEEVSRLDDGPQSVGGTLEVTARVHLGEVLPQDVQVEVYHGLMDGVSEIVNGGVTPMQPEGEPVNGVYTYKGAIPCSAAGRHGFAVRVVPNHPDIVSKHSVGLIQWG